MNIHIDIILAVLCMGILVSSSDSISPPILTAKPEYLLYYKGETVTLTCAIQEGYRSLHFTFYKNNQAIQNGNTHTYKIYGMHLSDVGSYSCEFWTGHYSSPRSNEVSLFIFDKMPPPVISLKPSLPVYNIGDSITILCSPPMILKVKMIQFYKEGYHQLLKEAENTTYVITAYNKVMAGRYSCTYSTKIQDRWMTSLSSEYMLLNVSDNLARPHISLQPSLSVYNMGESVTIICSPPNIMDIKRIAFYKEGIVQPLKEAEDDKYSISTSNKEVAGRYSCTYTLDIQNKWMTSLSSEYILVSVSVSTPQTTATTITQETPTTDTISKTRDPISTTQTTATTITQETPTTDTISKTRDPSLLKIIIYVSAGGLIFMIVFLLIQGVFQFYIPLNRKREGTMVELNVSESNLPPGQNMKTIEEPSIGPTAQQEMEMEQFYSEIDLSTLNTATPIASMYAKANAIDPLPPVYLTDLTTHARN